MRLLDDTVRQLFFDINIEGDSSSISLGEEVATYCNTELINTIEKQLSVYQNRSHTTIDILEIDLGSVSSNEWKSLLKNKLNESLHEQIKITLKSKDFETVSPDTTEFLANKTFDEKVLKQIKKHPKHIKKFNENKLEDSSSENHNLNNLIENAFFFYLEKGYLPWWYSINTTSTIIKEYLNQHTQKNRVTLLFILQNNQKALQRFISVTNNEKINSVSNIIRISKKFTEVNLTIYKALSKTIAPTLKEKEFQIAYREILILKNDDLFQGAKKAKIFFLESLLKHENIQQRLNALDEKIIELKIEYFLKKIQTIWPNLDLKNIIKLFKNLSVKNNQQNSKHTTKPKGSIENIIKPIKETGNEEKAQKTENNLPSKESKLKNQTKSIEAEEKEGVYVQYSGIILLHPFLPSFFTKLNLLENGQWKNEESSKKAVQL